jgi:hypothetical protein
MATRFFGSVLFLSTYRNPLSSLPKTTLGSGFRSLCSWGHAVEKQSPKEGDRKKPKREQHPTSRTVIIFLYRTIIPPVPFYYYDFTSTGKHGMTAWNMLLSISIP